jgi:chromosomal replication initiator protein
MMITNKLCFLQINIPNYIPNLEERLKSRFGAGMIIDIPHPDQESRAAILRAKAKLQGFELNPEH